MSQKKYWKGLEEYHSTEGHQKIVKDEFAQELDLSEDLLNANTPRRDFLKFLGFSTLAATVAASCEMPVRKAIPYAIKPDAETQTPGVANYYASTFVENGDTCSVLVKTRDGRPIMIEGNNSSTITQGGVNARIVASTLNLYDTYRLRGPMQSGERVDAFADLDKKIISELTAASQIVILSGTINSPTSLETINTFKAKFPNTKHVQYDPISYSGMLLGNEASFGKKALPSYHFDQAKAIFSLGADFLGTWLSPVEFTKGYSKNRRVNSKNPVMSKHYQVEAMMTITGASADDRATCKPSEYGKVATALLNAITSGTKPSLGSETLNTLIVNAAKDLKAGGGLVVCGANDANIQQVVNAINSVIGAYGTTISWAVTSNNKQGIDSEMVDLVAAMNAGQVGALILWGVNPSYQYFDAAKFNDGLKKVKTTISLNDRLDETSEQMTYVVPASHWLESWGDAEPKTGYYSFMQPTIAPLFKTRQAQDSLLTWAGVTETYHDLFNKYWSGKFGSQNNFDKVIQEGVAMPATHTISGGSAATPSADVLAAAEKAIPSGEYELLVYESIAMGAGDAHSNNPWLQEMPDPITKATWDNFVMMSPATAKKKEFDAELTGINQVETKKRVLKVTVGSQSIELPVVVIPGMHNNVIAVALGYGRSGKVGKAAKNTGKNAFPLMTFANGSFHYSNPVSIEKTSKKYDVAITQTHQSYEARKIIREFTLEEFKKNPLELINDRREDLKHYISKPWEHHEFKALTSVEEFDARQFERDFEKNGTLYPVHEKQGIHWGMSIDLNTCTGCGACVVACQAENNVSVVGKTEVMKAQEMSWIRIDRYFSGNPDDPDSIQAVFQPMMCQHCDNAPCENVCPVSATNHSSEGLNQMAYNRCIGTKYCANNCPYKVRHFNWFDFNGADSFKDNLYEDGRRDDINDDLTRMVLNPDVTVRSRGVMEKCSFCVQRLQDGKLQAKKEGQALQDHHVSTACQKACPSDSIVFGNINDTDSAIYKARYQDNKDRLYYVLEQLHILPNVSYLSRIRNTDEVVAGKAGKDGIYEQHI